MAMPSTFNQLPWINPLLRTALTIGVAYVLGHAMRAFVAGRLARLAHRTQGKWDDILIEELTTRIPLWSVLIGIWLSLGDWPMADRWLRLASGAISIVGFATVTLALAAIATRLVATYGARAASGAPVSGLTQNVVRLVIVALGLLVMLNELGVEIRPMLAALGVGGLAVALALQEPLSNLFAGLFVSIAGQVRIGDQVRLDTGVEGRVVDFNWRSTWLELPSSSIAVVPNAKLSQAIVTNFSLPTPEVAVPIEVVVDYESDAAQVERVATDVARGVLREVEGGIANFEPVVRFHAFGEVGLRATVVLRARTLGDLALVRHAFITRLHTKFREAGIVFPSIAAIKPGRPSSDGTHA